MREVLAVYHESHLGDTRPASQERMREHRRELEAILGGIEAERLTYADLLRYRREGPTITGGGRDAHSRT